jgi:hypothetical protein
LVFFGVGHAEGAKVMTDRPKTLGRFGPFQGVILHLACVLGLFGGAARCRLKPESFPTDFACNN